VHLRPARNGEPEHALARRIGEDLSRDGASNLFVGL